MTYDAIDLALQRKLRSNPEARRKYLINEVRSFVKKQAKPPLVSEVIDGVVLKMGIDKRQALETFSHAAHDLCFIRLKKGSDPRGLNYRVTVPTLWQSFFGRPKVADAESRWWLKGVVPMPVLRHCSRE